MLRSGGSKRSREWSEKRIRMDNLFIQTAFVGDLFLSIPALKRIKEIDPDTSLILYCRRGLGETFLKLNLVDEVVEVDKSNKVSFLKSQNYLKSKRYKRIIAPHQSLRNTWLVGQLQAEEKIGYYKFWNSFFFDHRVRRPLCLPEVLRQMVLFQPIDPVIKKDMQLILDGDDYENSTSQESVKFYKAPKIPQWASLSILDRVADEPDVEVDPGTVFLAPGSVWNTKKWTESGFSDLAKKLLHEGASVTLIGSPQEREICDRIAQSLPQARVLAGELSLYQTLLALSRGKALICNDSGAMHMAAAVDLPTVSIFGPTTLTIGYRPWNDQSIVVQKPLSCRPCGLHGAKKCPIQTHECMKMISAIDVFKAFHELLREHH